MASKEVIVKFAKDGLWQNRFSPWKWYKCGVSFGFGATFVTNTTTGLLGQSNVSPYQYPGGFFGSVLVKSAGYGIIFPAIPIKLLTDPKDYLVL